MYPLAEGEDATLAGLMAVGACPRGVSSTHVPGARLHR